VSEILKKAREIQALIKEKYGLDCSVKVSAHSSYNIIDQKKANKILTQEFSEEPREHTSKYSDGKPFGWSIVEKDKFSMDLFYDLPEEVPNDETQTDHQNPLPGQTVSPAPSPADAN